MFATVRMMVMVKCINSQNGGDGQVFATVSMVVKVKCLQQSEWW